MSHEEWGGNPTPLKIMDLTLRDGHQSLFATRMRTEDMIPVAERLDEAGFWAAEIWGGATFDTMSRFLGEDPWERPRTLRKYAKKTPFAMLLRGRTGGYRNYADDVPGSSWTWPATASTFPHLRRAQRLPQLRGGGEPIKTTAAFPRHICYS